jgi:radical SAM superfamily enzyme YgiQ (UPF0313 family)
MRILLINPPIRERVPALHHPFGLASIAQVLRNAGHSPTIYDINSTRHSREEVAHYLPREEFDMVGVGGLITTYKYFGFLFPLLREKYKQATLVLGGGGITSAPEVFMENLRPDYGVLGEGEYTTLELANGDNPSDISGLVYYEADKLKFNPPRPLEKDLDKFGMGAIDLLDMEKYKRSIVHNHTKSSELSMIATRGCPRSCAFCYHIFGRSCRYRSVESVLDEIEYLVDKYGAESITFADELFTSRRSYVMQFCEELLKRRVGVEWSCLARVDSIDEEMVALMSRAGCIHMGFGIESGSQRILDEMNKGVTVEQAADAMRLANGYFRTIRGSFIFGMPGENNESIAETIAWCAHLRLRPTFYHLNPYPGTKVYHDNFDKIMEKYGSEHNYFSALGDASEFVINLTKYTDSEYWRHMSRMDVEIGMRSLIVKPIRLADGSIPEEYILDGKVLLIHPKHISGEGT